MYGGVILSHEGNGQVMEIEWRYLTLTHREPSLPFRIRIKDQTTLTARVCLFCEGHFEFLIRARSANARSGTDIAEITRTLLGALIGERSDPC